MTEDTNKYCFHCMSLVDPNKGIYCANCGKKHSVHYSKSDELPAGTYLNNERYFVGRSIGSGGFGISYIGYDTKLERKILIKETFYYGAFQRNIHDLDDPEPLKVSYDNTFSLNEIMKKTKKECISLTEAEGLNNIVKVYDWFSENNTAYIITEFINGVTLDKRVFEKGRYSWDELYQKLKPLINSLSLLHKKGIIHRDIKPQNIMIKTIENVGEEFILIDFGLARSTETRTLPSVGISFSLGYSPIEQRTFTMPDGEYTDVYALAATIYFALTGESPSADMVDTIEGNFPEINNLSKKYDVPHNVCDALTYALDMDYRKRCGSLKVLMQMFQTSDNVPSASDGRRNSYTDFSDFAASPPASELSQKNTHPTVYAEKSSPAITQNTVNNTDEENISAAKQQSTSIKEHTNRNEASAPTNTAAENLTINVTSESDADDVSINRPAAKPKQSPHTNNEKSVNISSTPAPHSDSQNAKDNLHSPNNSPDSEKVTLKAEPNKKLKYILISSFLVIALITSAVVLSKSGSESVDNENTNITASSSSSTVSESSSSSVSESKSSSSTVSVSNSSTSTASESVTAEGECGKNAAWKLVGNTLYISGSGEMTNYENNSAGSYIIYHDERSETPWKSYSDDIKSIEIENGITSIGDSAFCNCTNLSDIAIPNGITTIGDKAFCNCTSLSEITIPESVTKISASSFEKCIKLSKITIPQKVTLIGSVSFSHCDNLSEITFKGDKPNLVSNGMAATFFGVTATVKYPKNNSTWNNIEDNWDGGGDMTFEAYGSDSSSTVSEKVTAQGECGSNATWKLVGNTLYINGNGKMTDYEYDLITSSSNRPWDSYEQEIKSVEIEDGITSIGDYAFLGCNNLSKVSIPDSVITIGDLSFSSCTTLSELTIPKKLTSMGRFSFSNCDAMSEIVIPNSITEISYGAFSGCEAVSEITIPDTVTSIDDQAFSECFNLSKITIPQKVTLIGSDSFSDCDNLSEITFKGDKPDLVSNGWAATFFRVTATVKYPKNNSTWNNIEDNWDGGGDMTFEAYSSDSSSTVSEKVTAQGECGSNATWKLVGNTLYINGSGKMTDYEYHLNLTKSSSNRPWDSYIQEIKSVEIEDGITSIGDYAFIQCKNLSKVTIPDSVIAIGDLSFSSCTTLSELTIPKKLTSMGHYSFGNCDSLSEIVIPNSITEISYGAFSGCEAVSEITIPDTVTSIDDQAFSECFNLSKITFKGNKPDFGGSVVFWGVTATVKYPKNNSTWNNIENNWKFGGKNITFEAY